MKYSLLHKIIGVNKTETICQFESKEKIKDICFIEKFGFFLLGENTLFLYSNELKPIANINNPNSMCCNEYGVIFIACEEGIKTINSFDDFYVSDLLTKHDYQTIFGGLKKIGMGGISISEFNNHVAISIAPLNKCIVYCGSTVKREIGGICGFAICNNINNSLLCKPQGVIMYSPSEVIISDTGNGCIRSFGEYKHRIIAGKPNDKTLEPTKMNIDRKKDILYYLSKNYLKSVNLNNGHSSETYSGTNVVSMTLWKQSKILYLEEIK